VYSQSLKQKLVQQMLMPGGLKAAAIARETGIGESTLHRWRINAATLGEVSKRPKPPSDPLRSSAPRRPDDRSADEKLRLVLEASALGEAGLGEFLRRHGLHEDDLAAWRLAALAGLSGPSSSPPAKSGDARRVRELEKELRRKDAALAETAALLVLKKKVQALWGDEDDDTNPRRDE